ncbi:MAG: hypothetical protein EAZ09_13255 [Oscillatoriales cyanobacterium]|nr:MAG: hypothetical protein EAZ18_12065 [Oscillatoriales cyanobacterium]TAH21061.1 MAG: hypothetical protein EAZ09_13255 [Oscillatoriales cyanobacterium]
MQHNSDTSEILHHSQLAFSEQAVRPVPQENSLFVEQAGQPVADMFTKLMAANCQLPIKSSNSACI